VLGRKRWNGIVGKCAGGCLKYDTAAIRAAFVVSLTRPVPMNNALLRTWCRHYQAGNHRMCTRALPLGMKPAHTVWVILCSVRGRA